MVLPATKRSERSMILRDTGQSAANAPQTVSTPTGKIRQLLFITVKYSATVTENVTVTLNSGEGSAWHTLLQLMVLTGATDVVFIPDGFIYVLDDDIIDVLAPAGGVGITSAVAIYTELPL